jgi:hypothetical protein
VRRNIQYLICLLLWLPGNLIAQRVIYSESPGNRSGTRLQVIGKSGSFYWVEKLQLFKYFNHHVTETRFEIQNFQLFDSRLALVSEHIPKTVPGTLKQWLMAGENSLDQIIAAGEPGKTKIICNQYSADQISSSTLIDSLPFSAEPSGMLLVRSGDHSKILLVAFENSDPAVTRIHALLYDSKWNRIYHEIIADRIFAQPCIQDEEIGFPAESFDNLPIKLADDGEWLMASPSRTSRNFSIFHACPNGRDYYFREVALSSFYKMEDVAMSIDNDQQEMSIGLLSGYKNTSLKNVQVYNYSMKQGRFDFDTSFHFNTQSRDIKDKNLSHESFIAVPGGGYMFLKEYGLAYEFDKPDIPFMGSFETAYLLANYRETNSNVETTKQGYTLNRGLSPIPYVRNRGDLNLFYFPGLRQDSTWSGVLDMEQHTETNNPDLSYLLVPSGNKLYIIYNSGEGYADPLATTTTLNKGGQLLDDALVFWKLNKMLNFQRSHRFAKDEIAIPYMNTGKNGFAVIRLQ